MTDSETESIFSQMLSFIILIFKNIFLLIERWQLIQLTKVKLEFLNGVEIIKNKYKKWITNK